MKARWITALVGSACLVTACVTIHIHFPTAAAESAADRIIDDVWGRSGERAPENQPQSRRPAVPAPSALAATTVNLLLPPAHAQNADIDVSSPAIQRIQASMRERHPRLEPHYESGAIGLTRNGLVELRDANAVPLAERNAVRQLVADENTDRNNLYREIAVANGNPQWESEIRETFARRWIDRARSGWYYRDSSGNWTRK